ncbi:MAG: sodium:proton antiporter NhaD [Bacteroidales bacterium]
MITTMILLFIVAYVMIAFEHPLRINKAAPALIAGMVMWVLYILSAQELVPVVSATDFNYFLEINPSLQHKGLSEQVIDFVVEKQVLTHIGDIAEIILFLMAAMAIVEMIDAHGGFMFITNRITTTNRKKLLWIIAFISFFMSAVLDNLTTSIVMVMLLRKLVANYKERWIFASIIIIAANAGGAWSPIGDVTTIMLWVKGNITTSGIIPYLFLPSFVSMVISTAIASRFLSKRAITVSKERLEMINVVPLLTRYNRLAILAIGVVCLLGVPVFKSITHLPPFIGMLLGLVIVWTYTELMYRRKKSMSENEKLRVSTILHRIDTTTIFFFLGILMAVSALEVSGVLGQFSQFIDEKIGNIYIINIVIGVLSSIVDNVPLVASAIGMYPVANEAMIATATNPEYLSYFAVDGNFWQFLAYCAGVGGNILIIGSAAGVVVMGLERINFVWYFKNISLLAFIGYLAGAAIYLLEVAIFQ